MDPLAVALAVSGERSRRAVLWAADNLVPHASRVVLVHVLPPLSSIPNPCGEEVEVERVGRDVRERFERDRVEKVRRDLGTFRRLCQTVREVEIVILHGKEVAVELLSFLSSSGIKNLVMGISAFSWFTRTFGNADVPTAVLKSASDACNIFLVSRWKLEYRLATPSVACVSVSAPKIKKVKLKMFTQRERNRIFDGQISRHNSLPSAWNKENLQVTNQRYNRATSGGSNISDAPDDTSQCSRVTLLPHSGEKQDLSSSNVSHQATTTSEAESLNITSSNISHARKQSEDMAELERLKIELENTRAMYIRACKDLILTKKRVYLLSVDLSEEARKVEGAMEREEVLRQIAEEEKARHLEAVREIEEAKQLLAEAALDRHKAEINAIRESSEKLKIVEAIFSRNKRCKRYTRDDIEVATENFSNAKVIGEGGYGKVYKCILDHTPVAIKVLHHDSVERKEQFLKEVEVLTKLIHPHIVLLLGVCPEIGCIVYEYMENESLEDRIFCKNHTRPLPWTTRFRIIFEVACGLAFLHSSKPDPIVHRDLKPDNILLDRNYVSKIGDVGLAKLMLEVVPDGVTEFRDTIIAGTLHYMDPEYQWTGTIRPKSDVYAFGMIILQMLTARRPLGLLVAVENALKSNSFPEILDKSVTGVPLVEAEKLARLALRCLSLRCRDRLDLETEIIPQIEEIIKVLDTRFKLNQSQVAAPSHYYCPILQEVMTDPYIAADGFTYEHIAIKSWLERHDISPVTKLKLQYKCLIPNYNLRSGIEEWKSNIEISTLE